MKKIIFIFLILFLFTGCYDYTELNDTAIISGIGADYKDKKYEITFEIITLQKDNSGSKSETKTMLVTGSGNNPARAFNNTISKVDKKVVFDHLQVVLLSENLAQEKGIKHLSNYLFRDIHVSNNFYYILAKDSKVKEIFKTKIKNEPVVSNALIGLFKNQNDVEIFDLKNEFDYLYAQMKDGKKDILIPSVKLKNNNISLATNGFFIKDKLKGFLSKQDSQTYNLLNSKVENALYSKQNEAISIYKNKNKINLKNNTVKIKVSAEGIIKCLNKNYVLRDGKINKKLSLEFAKMIKKDIQKLVETSLEENSDFLGFRNLYYRTYPQNYQKDIWKSLKYDVEVNLEVNRNGQAFEVIN